MEMTRVRSRSSQAINTISRRLSKAFGLKSCKHVKKSKLIPIMKKTLEFARKHLY